jgi:hypothetical protein
MRLVPAESICYGCGARCIGCMESVAVPKPVVRVPFVCPVCATANQVNLIALSRAGGVTCESCKRFLKSRDVARAMHAPRTAK